MVPNRIAKFNVETGLKSAGHMSGLNQTVPVHAEPKCRVSSVREPCLTYLPFCKSIYRLVQTWTSSIFCGWDTKQGTLKVKLKLADQILCQITVLVRLH